MVLGSCDASGGRLLGSIVKARTSTMTQQLNDGIHTGKMSTHDQQKKACEEQEEV